MGNFKDLCTKERWKQSFVACTEIFIIDFKFLMVLINGVIG